MRFFSNKTLGFFMGLLVLSGQVSLRADDENRIVVWAMGEEGKKIAIMARKFEKENPGIIVETQAIPWGAAHAKLLTSVVGQIPPDISQMGTTWMAEFAAMKALSPLDDFASQSELASPDRFFSGSLQTCYVDNNLYGVPWYVDTRVLFYRKDLLADVGFHKPPETWEELKTASSLLVEKMTRENGKKNYGLSLGVRGWPELLMNVWQNGADPLKPTSDEFKEALSHYVSFFREGISPTKDAADVNLFHAFKTGYLPMYISGPWMVSLTKKELPELEGKWGVSVLPGKKSRKSFVGGSNFVIFRDSKKKKLAWKFIEFMSDPENQAKWFSITSGLPSAKKAWDNDIFKDKPMIRIFGEQMNYTESPPSIPEWEQIAHAIENTMEKIILQEIPSDENISQELLSLESKILKIQSPGNFQGDVWKSFLVVLFIIFIVPFSVWFLKTYPRPKVTSSSKPPKVTVKSAKNFIEKNKVGYLFVFPAVILLFIFLFMPLFLAFLMSLTDLNVFNINSWSDIGFVGWHNYLKIVKDPVFWKAMWNTLYFAGIGVPLTIAVSLFAALALNQEFVIGKPFFRVSFFAPVITTIVAVAVVWKWIYNPEFGLFNWFLQSLGLKPLQWLADPKTALPSLIIMAVWKNFGYNMVIFLAGLQTIPKTQYEAARIDGANSWQCFRYVTLPGLAPTMVFVLILTSIGYLQFFAEPYVMTKGGPLNATVSIVYYMYKQGFRFFELGYASAISYVLFGLIFCFTMIQIKLKKSGFDTN